MLDMAQDLPGGHGAAAEHLGWLSEIGPLALMPTHGHNAHTEAGRTGFTAQLAAHGWQRHGSERAMLLASLHHEAGGWR